ncbi:hypothetical protein K227x_26100 [Rubripirellula lacrimiformis]|uniref:Uncharacterized protein n=1 Tax=Rubripirellula lacrimiformis TaxID=1930273 RepID=A0A517NAR5_9BACT|nr:SIR2 family protein [Rubripirellula lacrimiformis]QDT04220.1 hypothetical protein K227x_26100 [Rubripirellula lacrimiformis]
MNLGKIKQLCQEHFSDGLVTIVGSGLSCAEGVSGMAGLAQHLLARIPSEIAPASSTRWEKIAHELSEDQCNLEQILLDNPPDDALEALIIKHTADLILCEEGKIIDEVLNEGRVLSFSKLIPHMLKPSNGVPRTIITVNYDRLIEIAVESMGLGIDSLFTGHHLAKHDPTGSRHSLCRSVSSRNKRVERQFCDHALILKPHGSLDWFRKGNEPVRCSFPLKGQRLIITPGLNKYQGGYERPFDAHREKANRKIDEASRFLILGYGFNDSHLQTHLNDQIIHGAPTLLITHSLSDNARELMTKSNAITAIVANAEESKADGAVIYHGGKEKFFPGPRLWDLNVFVSEVFGHA